MTGSVPLTTLDADDAYRQSVWWAEGNEFCILRSTAEVAGPHP